MIPAAVLVVIDLIIVSTFTLYNIFKNREQDKRIDKLEGAAEQLARAIQDKPIVTPPPRGR